MEGCTLVGVFIALEQEMQEFGRLSMLSDYFLWSGHAQKKLCGSHDPVHLVFDTIWWEMLKIVYPPIPFYHYITIASEHGNIHFCRVPTKVHMPLF